MAKMPRSIRCTWEQYGPFYYRNSAITVEKTFGACGPPAQSDDLHFRVHNLEWTVKKKEEEIEEETRSPVCFFYVQACKISLAEKPGRWGSNTLLLMIVSQVNPTA